MSRIRTIKPEFFRHEGLQDLQNEHPLLNPMLVFVGLWSLCDKQGVFEWRPRQIKLDVLPFLTFDMTAALQLLERHGFIQRYTVEGKTYGYVTSFNQHQRITGREGQEPARFPAPDVNETGDAAGMNARSNRDTPGTHHGHTGDTPGTHRGSQEREMEREEEEERNSLGALVCADVDLFDTPALSLKTKEPTAESKHGHYPPDFEAVWQAYPPRAGGNSKQQAYKIWTARRNEGVSVAEMLAGVQRYHAYLREVGKLNTEYVQQASTFFGPKRGYAEAWAPPDNAGKVIAGKFGSKAEREAAGWEETERGFLHDGARVIEHG